MGCHRGLTGPRSCPQGTGGADTGLWVAFEAAVTGATLRASRAAKLLRR